MTETQTVPSHQINPVEVDHVVDGYRCYPGETITFYTRVSLRQPMPELRLSISLPSELELAGYRPPPELLGPQQHPDRDLGDPVPALVFENGSRSLMWRIGPGWSAGDQPEYQLQARVALTPPTEPLKSRALVSTVGSQLGLAQESVTVAVDDRSRSLRYLPGLYEADELLTRLLMAFDSFWAATEAQIDNIHLYFDPKMTPVDFLPWLASWLGLLLDEDQEELRQRELIACAVRRFRKRGTLQGLKDSLEAYTGREADIVEHCAYDFILGHQARLGMDVALGPGNQPHTFTVKLSLPPSAGEDEDGRRERMLRRIRAIIEAEKPAHTAYRQEIQGV